MQAPLRRRTQKPGRQRGSPRAPLHRRQALGGTRRPGPVLLLPKVARGTPILIRRARRMAALTGPPAHMGHTATRRLRTMATRRRWQDHRRRDSTRTGRQGCRGRRRQASALSIPCRRRPECRIRPTAAGLLMASPCRRLSTARGCRHLVCQCLQARLRASVRRRRRTACTGPHTGRRTAMRCRRAMGCRWGRRALAGRHRHRASSRHTRTALRTPTTSTCTMGHRTRTRTVRFPMARTRASIRRR